MAQTSHKEIFDYNPLLSLGVTRKRRRRGVAQEGERARLGRKKCVRDTRWKMDAHVGRGISRGRKRQLLGGKRKKNSLNIQQLQFLNNNTTYRESKIQSGQVNTPSSLTSNNFDFPTPKTAYRESNQDKLIFNRNRLIELYTSTISDHPQDIPLFDYDFILFIVQMVQDKWSRRAHTRLAHTAELRQVWVSGDGTTQAGQVVVVVEEVQRGSGKCIKACVRDVVLGKKTNFCRIGREAP